MQPFCRIAEQAQRTIALVAQPSPSLAGYVVVVMTQAHIGLVSAYFARTNRWFGQHCVFTISLAGILAFYAIIP